MALIIKDHALIRELLEAYRFDNEFDMTSIAIHEKDKEIAKKNFERAEKELKNLEEQGY